MMEFDFDSSQPSNLFHDSINVPETDEISHIRQVRSLEGKKRSLDIASKQLAIGTEIAKLKGQYLTLQNQEGLNQILVEDGRTIEAKIAQAQARTDIELGKLEGLRHDARGYRAMAQITGHKWDLTIKQNKLELLREAEKTRILEADIANLLGKSNGTLPGSTR